MMTWFDLDLFHGNLSSILVFYVFIWGYLSKKKINGKILHQLTNLTDSLKQCYVYKTKTGPRGISTRLHPSGLYTTVYNHYFQIYFSKRAGQIEDKLHGDYIKWVRITEVNSGYLGNMAKVVTRHIR